MTKRVWLAAAPLLLLAVAGGIWWWSTRPPPPIVWQGYAEADFVMVGPTQQGLLSAVFVARGDAIATGAPLFTQDDTDDRAARDQAAQMLAQAARQLVNLEAGAKPTEIQQAEGNLASAQATLARTVADLARGESLLPRGTRRSKASISFGPTDCRPRPRSNRCRRRWRSRGPLSGGKVKLKRSARRWRRRVRCWTWPSGGLRNAASPRRQVGASPTCWLGRGDHGGGRAGRFAAAAGQHLRPLLCS